MKKHIYIFLWIVLGFLLSGLSHFGAEIWLIDRLLAKGAVPVNYGSVGGYYCALPFWFQSGLVVFGVFGGFFAGRFFWRKVYIEHCRKTA